MRSPLLSERTQKVPMATSATARVYVNHVRASCHRCGPVTACLHSKAKHLAMMIACVPTAAVWRRRYAGRVRSVVVRSRAWIRRGGF